MRSVNDSASDGLRCIWQTSEAESNHQLKRALTVQTSLMIQSRYVGEHATLACVPEIRVGGVKNLKPHRHERNCCLHASFGLRGQVRVLLSRQSKSQTRLW